jgi:ribosomal protein S18 acetylase RimI-like enzyme
VTSRVRVRPGHAADADAAAAVFLACWHRSYAHVLPARVRARYDEASARAMWRRIFAAADGVLVADVAGRGVCGVTRYGPDPDQGLDPAQGPDADQPAVGHIFSLYVHPDAQGLGLGRALLEAATERLRAAGHREATLWVFAANTGARGFYERLGWRPDGGTRVEEAYGEPELRLRRALTAAS